jgi:hypothetical protein
MNAIHGHVKIDGGRKELVIQSREALGKAKDWIDQSFSACTEGILFLRQPVTGRVKLRLRTAWTERLERECCL